MLLQINKSGSRHSKSLGYVYIECGRVMQNHDVSIFFTTVLCGHCGISIGSCGFHMQQVTGSEGS